jgi:nifR3 family TIM-barrel protein
MQYHSMKMDFYRPVKIGSLELSGNLFAAPVAGFSDRSFRSLCAVQGASLCFTELVSAEAVYRNPQFYGLAGASGQAQAADGRALSLAGRGESEKRYAVQLFAGNPQALYNAAILLAPLKPDALDINCGCPVPKVVKNGAGAALMKDPRMLAGVVRAAVRASGQALGGIPVTVKMRSGWDTQSLNYRECAAAAVEAGAAMVSLHPRTRSQGYSGKSDWQCIADLASRLSVPVTGSGDLYTPEDALEMLRRTGCAAVMFARGAMGNPFIFSATKELLETGRRENPDPGLRLAAALKHLEMLAADIGEVSACLEMRKQFCAYIKGMKGASAARERAVRAKSIEDYRALADEWVLHG